MPPDDTIVLEIPADAAHLVTARVFASALGRQCGLGESRVDDFKLAVSDISTWLLGGATPDRSITIRATVGDDRIEVDVRPNGFPLPTAGQNDLELPEEMLWGLALVGLVTDDFEVRNGPPPAVTFSLPLTT